MYKVLLVDDEILDLEGMKAFIPWHELGMEVVGAVNNGFAAYEVIENEEIDILVTDVRMPNMSGLELAKKALDKQKGLRVVFISGYQDFNYIKQALTLNAVNYVLKPMDDQELIDSLMLVSRELDVEHSRKTREKTLETMIPIVKNEYLLRLLEGTHDQATLQVLQNEYGLSDSGEPLYVAVLEMDDFSWELSGHDAETKQRMTQELQQYIGRLCEEFAIEHLCKLSHERYAVVTPNVEALNAIGTSLDQETKSIDFTVTIGVGTPTALSMLHEGYLQALEALEYKMFYGKGRMIQHHQVQRSAKEDAQHLDIQLDALLDAMANYDLVQIHDELAALYELATDLKSKFVIHHFTVYIITKLSNYLDSMGEDLLQILGMEFADFDILQRFETIDDIHAWLRRRIFELSEKLHMKHQRKNWKLVREIIHDIKDQLHENFTLKDIADKHFFSPNYLGLLFKEATGKNFSEYVIMLRMEKASELLRETSLKVYEIADQVGYRYLPYFSKQFKEQYGMSPLEYRKKH